MVVARVLVVLLALAALAACETPPADPQQRPALFQNPAVRCSGIPLFRTPWASLSTQARHSGSPLVRHS